MATVTNPTLSNSGVWAWSRGISPPPPGHILSFAFVARFNRLPNSPAEFDASNHEIYSVAAGTGINGCLIAGATQYLGHLPSLGELNSYLDSVGVRDPKTGNLLHSSWCPGPGDGVVFSAHPSATDPGLGTATGGAVVVRAPAPTPGAAGAAPPTSAPLGVLAGGAPDVQAVAQHALNDPLGFVQHHPFLAAGGAFLAYRLLLGGRRL